MLSRKTLATGAAIALFCSPSMAQDLVGGEVTLGYSGFTDQVATADGDERPGQIFVGLSGEVGLGSMVSVQGDLSYHSFNVTDEDALNLALHAVFHVNDDAALGLFYGNESIAGFDSDFYGVEGAFETGILSAETYYLEIDEGADFGAHIFGIGVDADVGNGYAVGLDYDQLGADGPGDLSRIAVTGKYEVEEGAAVYVEIGSLSADTGGLLPDASETFFGIGVEYSLGPNRGTTFGRRSLAYLIPGL